MVCNECRQREQRIAELREEWLNEAYGFAFDYPERIEKLQHEISQCADAQRQKETNNA